MTYRILSPCAILGYGIDERSLHEAAKTKLDLIAADAGSVDPGPYYLGQGASYMKRPNVKRDFSLMLQVALRHGCPLLRLAPVIRSKNAGVNRITYNILFDTAADYRLALRSNAFLKENIAQTLGIPTTRVIKAYRADACRAIKISTWRAAISGSPGDRDVFGAQQHAKLLSMRIPV